MIRTKRHRPTSWSKEQSCKLIEEVQQHPALYDQMHPFYQHRAHRFAALRSLIAKLKPIQPNITPKMILRKLTILRHQYYKEKSRMENPPANLIDIHGKYQPRLWCYDMLQFLDEAEMNSADQPPTLSKRKKQEKVENEDVEEDSFMEESNESNYPFEKIEIERVDDQRQTPTENQSQTRSDLHTKCLGLIDTLTSEIKTVKVHKGNDTVISSQASPKTFLALLVESELSTVSEDIYHDSKWRIIRVLEEAITKERAKQMRNGQTNLPSTSASTSSPNLSYDLGGEKRVIILDKAVYKAPAHTPICSTVNVRDIGQIKSTSATSGQII